MLPVKVSWRGLPTFAIPENTLPRLLSARVGELARNQVTLTIAHHLRVSDDVVEEGEHLDHLIVLAAMHLKSHLEGLWNVGFEEVRVDSVDDL